MAIVKTISAIAFCATLAFAGRLFANDPGDLFPDVPYSDKVSASPVTHQEASLKKPTPVPTPTTLPANPPRPRTHPHTPAQTQPATPVAATPQGPPIWVTYSQTFFTPFLTAEDREVFDRDYAPSIQTALKGTAQDRKDASDIIFETAGKTASPTLQRYLYLHALGLAIRGGDAVADREKKATAVIPLLNDRTLAVAQARAECLNNLVQSSSVGVSDTLTTMAVHAYATLAVMQCQAGYADEANTSFTTARQLLIAGRVRNSLLSAELIAAKDWTTRASVAARLLPGLRTKLAAEPKDGYSNSQVALIELGLHGNLQGALPYAANSDNPQLRALAVATKNLDLDSMNSASATDAQAALPIINALADVAKSVDGPDRFLVANLAKHRLEPIATILPKLAEHMADAGLRKISDKLMAQADPYDSLADMTPAGPAAASQPAAGPNANLSFVSVASVFSNCQSIPAQMATDNQVLAGATNAWLRKNVIGARLATTGSLLQAGDPVQVNDKSYIPLKLWIPNVQVGDVLYNVYIQAQCDPKMAEAIGQLQPGQDLTVGGTIAQASVQVNLVGYYYNTPSIYITLSGVGAK